MSYHRLAGGTDIAMMTLFDIDAVPKVAPPTAIEEIEQLALQERLILFPTDSDGVYLLHLIVDEPVPAHIETYCVAEEKISGRIHVSNGRVAFGGAESIFQDFPPNHHIRSDAVLPPGHYSYTSRFTAIPDQQYAEVSRIESTSAQRWLGRAPVLVFLLALALGGLFAVTGRPFMCFGALVLGFYLSKAIRRSAGYAAFAARKVAAQTDLPSIVVQMHTVSLQSPL